MQCLWFGYFTTGSSRILAHDLVPNNTLEFHIHAQHRLAFSKFWKCSRCYARFEPCIFGGSKDIAIMTVAAASLLLAASVQEKASPDTDRKLYLNLIFTATIVTGIFRLWFVVDFFTHSTIVGIMSGAAITICPQQLKGLFGLAYFTTETDMISVLHAVSKNPDEILSFVPPIMYAIFVPLGTVAAASLFPAATIQENMSPDTDPHLYPNSIFIGIFQSVLGFLRLGIVVDFLSHSMIVGFISGTATVLSQQQLKGMFGLTHLATKADVISLSHAVLKNRDEMRIYLEKVVSGGCTMESFPLGKR